MSIPRQEHCDPTDPKQHLKWALVGLPGPKNAPMLVHPRTVEAWSQHLWDLGFRHHPEEQKKEYHAPVRGPLHWANGGAGQWKPMGTPKPPRITAPDVTHLAPEERAEIVRQLRMNGDLDHLVDPRDNPDTNIATIGRATETRKFTPDGGRVGKAKSIEG